MENEIEKKEQISEDAETESTPAPKRAEKKSVDVQRLAYLGIFAALVFVAQILAIPIGGFFETSALPVAVIVVGSALLGVKGGGALGLVFSIAVLCLPGTQAYLTFGDNRIFSVFCTLLTVILKGVLAGVAAGFVYKLLEKINRYIAVIVAGAAAVTANTGIFILGSILFFDATFAALVPVVLLVSYPLELGTSVLLAPAVLRVINIKKTT